MKNILVTGGAGFIGSHLCDRLLNNGDKVICLDNMFTGTYANISDFFSNPNFTFINANVMEPMNFEIDEIYNLACPASPIHYQFDPIMTTKTSFLGALNVLELAKNKNARVLQASTSEVYGEPLIHPQSEDYYGNVSTIGPRACYDEGKRISETLFFDYKRQHQVDICVIRIFNTYGPRMLENDGRVVSNFIVQALRNKDITIYGDGSQTRSFCYIDDLVNAIVAVMGRKGLTGPINLGNPCEISIKKLADLVIRLTNSSSKITYEQLPINDPSRRKPSIEYAKKELDWEPRINLEEGLMRTIDYFRGN